MGNSQTTIKSDTRLDNIKPVITEYIDNVKQIQNLCTTCEKNWNANILKNAVNSLSNVTVISPVAPNKMLSEILKKVNDETKIEITNYFNEEKKATEKATKLYQERLMKLATKNMENMIETITQTYARDLFKLLAQELREKNPWKTAFENVMVLLEVLGQEWNDRAKIALIAVRDSKREFEKYYYMVEKDSLYRDPASSGTPGKPIKTAPDWAQAIRTLPRVYKLLESHYTPIYTIMEKAANAKLAEKKT